MPHAEHRTVFGWPTRAAVASFASLMAVCLVLLLDRRIAASNAGPALAIGFMLCGMLSLCSIAFDRLRRQCATCRTWYTQYCQPCCTMLIRAPHPLTMTDSERYREMLRYRNAAQYPPALLAQRIRCLTNRDSIDLTRLSDPAYMSQLDIEAFDLLSSSSMESP